MYSCVLMYTYMHMNMNLEHARQKALEYEHEHVQYTNMYCTFAQAGGCACACACTYTVLIHFPVLVLLHRDVMYTTTETKRNSKFRLPFGIPRNLFPIPTEIWKYCKEEKKKFRRNSVPKDFRRHLPTPLPFDLWLF
jgi:hypothetical protein